MALEPVSGLTGEAKAHKPGDYSLRELVQLVDALAFMPTSSSLWRSMEATDIQSWYVATTKKHYKPIVQSRASST
jgi:hypothetical protein